MDSRGNPRRLRACVLTLAGMAACVGGMFLLWRGLGAAAPAPFDFLRDDSVPPAALTATEEARIAAFCGDCHALPRPESFARDRWHYEVRRGYEFYAKSGRNDLDPPPFYQTLAYFRARAPEQLTFPQSAEAPGPPPIQFQPETFSLPPGLDILPEIAHLRWVRLASEEGPVLLASDLRYGQVVAIDLKPQGRKPPRVLAQLRNPGRLEVCDLNGDGRLDVVVADLGSYLPSDHDRGRVVWLRRRSGAEPYAETELATGLGRVADVRAADVDGDGRLELIVAEFGWRDTGRLLLLRNVAELGQPPRWKQEEIDDRPGALDVRMHDFNRDGRPDVAVLFSQEYECIDLFLNRGPALPPRFARRGLWAAPDLTFGGSGIELADLNGDGQIDILATNGDAFDNDYATPWHGVQWLENRGELTFVPHRLTEMPGAYRALPGDFDGDGDLDIVVVARLPPKVQPQSLTASPLASIVLLRQTEPGVFARHTLEHGAPYYPTLETGDFDGDGDLDFAIASGPYTADVRSEQHQSHYLAVWWNQTADAK